MASEAIIARIKSRRGQILRPKRKPPKRAPVWLFPSPVERRYQSALVDRVEQIARIIREKIFTNLRSLVESRDELLPPAARGDNFAEEADRLMAASMTSIESTNFDRAALARSIGIEVNDWNEKEWQKQIKAALGINIYQRELLLTPYLDSFVKENVQLITRMEQEMVSSIDNTLQRGLRAGDTSATIAKNIEDRVGVYKSRARLIARDQVGKFNGDLTKLKQSGLGVETYIWRTSDDERVRASHRQKDDKRFAWGQPPADTGHPGRDIQGRCYAEPVWEGLFDELNGG